MTREHNRLENIDYKMNQDVTKIENMAKIKQGGQAYDIIKNDKIFDNTLEG